jgi:hypothetical protein
MRTTLPIVLATVFICAPSQTSRAVRLQGCADPATTAAALEKIQRNAWRQLSGTRVAKLWPNFLEEEKCKTDDGSDCRILRTHDRTKDRDFGCGEAFAFRTDPKNAGSLEYLERIFVHYSATTKEDAIAASRILVRGLGVPDKQAAVLGQELSQSFEWDVVVDGVRQSYSGELRLIKNNEVWLALLIVGTSPH